MAIKYCKVCNRNVTPIKKFSWVWFLIMLGVFYLPYYFLLKKRECPICHSKKFEKAHKELIR